MNQDIRLKFEPPAQALERYNPCLAYANASSDSINIYSTIGDYGDGAGMTPKIVDSVLRKLGGADVTVNINSPGGDFFDGVAIHTLLSEYKGDVTVNVVGMAASAASIVALAGDTINIAESGFFMIHNAWTLAIGNKNDMKQVAGMLEKFDNSMAGLYAKRTGLEETKIRSMMDKETWLGGKEAVSMGFALALLGADEVEEDNEVNAYESALKKMDVALAKAGMPRSERRALIKELVGMPGATTETTPRAGYGLEESLKGLLQTLTN